MVGVVYVMVGCLGIVRLVYSATTRDVGPFGLFYAPGFFVLPTVHRWALAEGVGRLVFRIIAVVLVVLVVMGETV